MTQTFAIANIDGHKERLKNKHFILWPATTLTITPGDQILCYRGPGPIDGIAGVIVTNGGGGYSSPPTVNFSGGGGSGAQGTAVLTGGVVTSVTMTDPGTGYTGTPAVSFTGGGGGGALGAANRGLVIPASDNSYVLAFGAFWNALYDLSSGFLGTTAGQFSFEGLIQFFNGPYCSAPSDSVNLDDPMFTDVEILAPTDYLLDPLTEEYPHTAISSPPDVHSQHLRPNAVGRTALSDAHPSSGNFVGGYLALITVDLAANEAVMSWYTDVNATFPQVNFMVPSGDGDQSTPGRYYIMTGSFLAPSAGQQETPTFIAPASQSGSVVSAVAIGSGGSGYSSAPAVSFSGGGGSGAAGTANVFAGAVVSVVMTNRGSGYSSPPTVSFSGGGGSGAAATAFLGTYAAVFPAAGPGDTQITFCTFFPGAAGSQHQTDTGGVLASNSTYYVRFCLYRSVTRGGYTQIVESPLSTFMAIPTTGNKLGVGGTDAHAVHFTLPKLPTLGNWTGFRIYMHKDNEPGGPEGAAYWLQMTVAGSTSGTTSVDINSYNATSMHPSYGFAAWPGLVNLNNDGTEASRFTEAYLMHVADVAHGAESTGIWQVVMKSGDSLVSRPRLALAAVGPAQMGAGAVSASALLQGLPLAGTASDGSGLAPTSGPASPSIPAATVSGDWSLGVPIVSTWNLTQAQYLSLMASGVFVKIQFSDGAGHFSAWSPNISSAVGTGVTSTAVLPKIGSYVGWVQAGLGAGGIVTDITAFGPSTAARLQVRWIPVNSSLTAPVTVSIFAKASGIRPV